MPWVPAVTWFDHLVSLAAGGPLGSPHRALTGASVFALAAKASGPRVRAANPFELPGAVLLTLLAVIPVHSRVCLRTTAAQRAGVGTPRPEPPRSPSAVEDYATLQQLGAGPAAIDDQIMVLVSR